MCERRRSFSIGECVFLFSAAQFWKFSRCDLIWCIYSTHDGWPVKCLRKIVLSSHLINTIWSIKVNSCVGVCIQALDKTIVKLEKENDLRRKRRRRMQAKCTTNENGKNSLWYGSKSIERIFMKIECRKFQAYEELKHTHKEGVEECCFVCIYRWNNS